MANADLSSSCDALIVLANEMSSDGVLNKESAARADLAAETAKRLCIPCIVTCGWAYRKDSKINIADAFKSYLVQNHGFDRKKIIAEINSRDTVGDAVFTRVNVAMKMNFRSICVVTSSYHVARTRAIFNFVYGDGYAVDVLGADVDFDEAVVTRESLSTQAFANTFMGVGAGSIAEIVSRLGQRHPFYNGDVFPKI